MGEVVLHERVSLLLDPQEEEGRLYFLLDFCEFGRGDFTMVRVIGGCCLLRLLNALVQTHLVVVPLQNELLLGDLLLRNRLMLRLEGIVFQSKIDEVFKAF